MNYLLSASVLILLGIAVLTDVSSHRISNTLILLGLVCSLVLQVVFYQVDGIFAWAGGLAVGLLCFLPLYMFGGMAAGDVKLVAMVGSFLGPVSVFWAAAVSLMAGGVLGFLMLLYKKQVGRFIQRYWTMTSLRTYIQPEVDDVARQPFPYAIAILLGTLASIFWQPFGQ
ncbi:A24 family peptidase [Pseudomonas sp.]|uniref:A24 family peptidase n=1 Tax=Pseudomonas sp. TaxID=306 RepID=UPI003BB6F331